MILRLPLLAALGGMAAACATAPMVAPDAACDRACLTGHLDTYLEAVLAHDPSAAPLFVGYRETQNSVAMPAGEGIWDSVTGFGPMQRRYVDPVLGNAVFFGVLEEGDIRAVASVRVKATADAITEAEWHIGRAADPGVDGTPGGTLFSVEDLLAAPPRETAPAGTRIDRAGLLAVANSYFDSIVATDRDVAIAHPGCDRYENGLHVTGRPIPEGRPADDGFEGRGDCLSGQPTFNVANIVARRPAVVDVDAQVVVISAVFVRDAGTPKRRNHFSDVMTIDDGRLRALYASMFYVDPALPVPNWPPYEGNFALTAGDVE